MMMDWTLYENNKTFFPGRKYRINVGPWWAYTPQIRYLGGLTASYEDADTWAGELAPNSGRKAIGLSGAALWRYRPDLELTLRLERNLIQDVVNESEIYQNDQIPPAVIFTVGFNYWR